MMGLTPQETRDRLDAVIEFAELEEFVDLKLKNYSSGMLVRLAFSLMLEVDADILLIDEVLAVGDAAFQQKCADAFREMKAAGKTIILVTHEMATVEEYCHRAMLIDGGKIAAHRRPGGGRPPLPAAQLRARRATAAPARRRSEDDEVRLLDAWVEDADGERVSQRSSTATPIRLRVELEATARTSPALGVGFILANADGVGVCQLRGADRRRPTAAHQLRAGRAGAGRGRRSRTRSAPGRYFVHCGVNRVPKAASPSTSTTRPTSSSSAGQRTARRRRAAARVERRVERGRPRR